MAKILVTGAGSAQSNGVINCLLKDTDENEIIGIGSDRYDLAMCNASQKYLVPHSSADNYKKILLKVLSETQPDMIHFQHDKELSVALKFRKEIESLNIKMLVPDYETIDTCVYKYKSWLKFKAAGIRVPENIIITKSEDLQRAFEFLGKGTQKTIWLRSMDIGGGGKGSLAVSDINEATEWIHKVNGWGHFVAAELLSANTVTWMSIWYKGELICAQGRKRHEWMHSALSPSGVTGVTKVGETFSSSIVDEIGIKACRAVSTIPHGLYGVDMTYDFDDIPNPTEINISRFFTTIQFFAEAGLNMPVISKNLCLYGKKPALARVCNPLDDGLLWIRAMDHEPILTTENEMDHLIINRQER